MESGMKLLASSFEKLLELPDFFRAQTYYGTFNSFLNQ